LAASQREVPKFPELLNGERKSTRNYSISKEYGGTEIVSVYEYPVIKEETEEEGYALVVADSRIPAVLTFVEYGSLADTLEIEPLNLYIKSIPQLIADFLEHYNSKDEDAAIQTRAAISMPNNNVELRDTIDGFNLDCSTPVWGQGAPYNASCPYMNCSSNGGRAVAGCVPIALGEIMKYHIDQGTRPNIIQSQFGYSNAAFIADIGTQVNANYGCSATGVPMSIIYSISKTALSYYGYSSGTWQNYSSWDVESSLLLGYPVYIIGSTPNSSPDYGAGHAWVIDGETAGDKLYFYFHMNWGWNGTSNGYFNCGAWSLPNSLTANGHTLLFSTFKILTHIH
jgi:hypothetical protein